MTREEAIEYFKRRKNQYGLSDNVQEAENMAIEALKEPPRVHAHWKCKKSMMYCSKCACGFDRAYRLDYNYCPNCCAIMDEERKDTE